MNKTKVCLIAAIIWSIVFFVCVVIVIKYKRDSAEGTVLFAYSVCALSAFFLAFIDFLRYGVYRKLDKDGHL